MNYIGIDGNVHSNELYHWKYIKKIGNRYFYTQDELRAYYNDQKKSADAVYNKEHNRIQKKRTEEKNKQSAKKALKAEGKARIKKNVDPVANTIKAAGSKPISELRKKKKKEEEEKKKRSKKVGKAIGSATQAAKKQASSGATAGDKAIAKKLSKASPEYREEYLYNSRRNKRR